MDTDDETKVQEVLWKIIGRFDFYIGSTNSKAAVIVAFNTFIMTGIVFKWADVGTLFAGYPKIISIINLLLFFTGVVSAISLWFVINAIHPFLKSPEHPMEYNSVIFFEHVARHTDPKDYLNQLGGMDSQSIVDDLGKQTHVLAKGLTQKFKTMKIATNIILFIQIPCFFTILAIKLCLITYTLL